MEGRELQHFFHEHPLILKGEQSKSTMVMIIQRRRLNVMVSDTNFSPFYSCTDFVMFVRVMRDKNAYVILIQILSSFSCHICRAQGKPSIRKYSERGMEGRELRHFFHEHPLILQVEQSESNGGYDHPETDIKCDGCLVSISGPFYSCRECQYFLHKVCAELPSELDYPEHPQHPLTLLERSPYRAIGSVYKCDLCGEISGSQFVYHCSECSFDLDIICASATHKFKDKCHPHALTPLQIPINFVCHICRKKEEGLSYKCYGCPFWVHQKCTLLADTVEHSDCEDPYPFVKLQHFFHDHPLILIANEHKTEDGIGHSNVEIKCYGCRTLIMGPFYSCGECRYFLHKVCAELPNALDHPLHPQHPLTLHKHRGNLECSLCRETWSRNMGLIYTCSKCSFFVDMTCASATHVIHDKCHPHPLTPSQVQISFPCHICRKKEEGLSYKCNICPFWVHQNCTLLPDTAKHSDHDHVLKLFPSIPFEFSKVSKFCDICHSKLFMFQCTYGCERCLFFAHVSCARSEIISTSGDQITDGQSLILLPLKQDSTDWISRFVQKYIDGDANIADKIDHFDHEHSLFLIDEKTSDNKTCEACAIRISAPSYGCVDCDYFLHKCCTDLPKQILHPTHPQHQLTLQSAQRVFMCTCCHQCCNLSIYNCFECEENFIMDIKCGSILEGDVVYHEAHKHPLFPSVNPSSTCIACGDKPFRGYILKCNTCSFELCFICAMAPCVIEHRYGGKAKEPFRLTYSPPENHYSDKEYLCEMCMEELNPKEWYYHCLFGDQFAHVRCMVLSGADSNVKYGKSHKFEKYHKEHDVTTILCKYDCSPCSRCRHPMRITGLYLGGGVGFGCKTCNFKRHLICPSKKVRGEKSNLLKKNMSIRRSKNILIN